jgi:hypothetical protein
MKNKEHTWPQILDEPNGSQILPGSRLKWGRQAENPFYTSLPKKKKKKKKEKVKGRGNRVVAGICQSEHGKQGTSKPCSLLHLLVASSSFLSLFLDLLKAISRVPQVSRLCMCPQTCLAAHLHQDEKLSNWPPNSVTQTCTSLSIPLPGSPPGM